MIPGQIKRKDKWKAKRTERTRADLFPKPVFATYSEIESVGRGICHRLCDNKENYRATVSKKEERKERERRKGSWIK